MSITPLIYNIPTLCIYSRLYYIVSASFSLFVVARQHAQIRELNDFRPSSTALWLFGLRCIQFSKRHTHVIITYLSRPYISSLQKMLLYSQTGERPNGHLATVMERQKGGPGSAAVTSKFPPTFRQPANETIRQKGIERFVSFFFYPQGIFLCCYCRKRKAAIA